MTLSFACQWMPSIHEPPEIRETSAKLTITMAQHVLTRNVDEWSGTVKDDIRLSAYPLAVWLASNWWRLRWESLPATLPTLSWRMSHELAAAGHGFVWPRLLFASDGETVQVWAVPSARGEPSPVNFLTFAHGILPGSGFEQAIDLFLANVSSRLREVGISGTMLQSLVAELSDERADPDLALYRRLEAMAGFDAGEGPADVLDPLEALVLRAGIDATQEMAALCVPDRSWQVFGDAMRISDQDGLPARPVLVTGGWAGATGGVVRPAWVRGKGLALAARRSLALGGQPIPDADLLDIMGVASRSMTAGSAEQRAPFGLAIRQESGRLMLHPRRSSSNGFRFELARYLGDNALAIDTDRWLPVTDSKTSRQKAQRAFAAEFLCPIDALKDYLGDDLSEDGMEGAASHFGVGTLAVRAQLVNNGSLPPEAVADREDDSSLPYPVPT